MNKVLYLTVTAPLGQVEAFLIPEMNGLVREEIDLTVIPVRPSGAVFHRDGAGLLRRCIITGLWSKEICLSVITWLVTSPFKVLGLLFLLLKSRKLINKVKNLLVFPKSLFIARMVKSLEINHIHAHWASTPSTCALIASALTGVPWSFTVHRWDIANDNLVAEKVSRSSFVRVISSRGGKQIVDIAGPEAGKKVFCCPMGVEMPDGIPGGNHGAGDRPLIASVGNLTALKGHRYLLEACRVLVDKGFDFKCLIVGDGPERNHLSSLAEGLGIKEYVIFSGALSHDRVLRLLSSGGVRLLVHPSVETLAGECEGVPVAVMEAMAHGVPVIVTDTGSVSDLVDTECGIKVPPGIPEDLAGAVDDLLREPARAQAMAMAAYRRVDKKFNLCKNIMLLLSRMEISTEGVCHGKGKGGESSHGDHRPDCSQ